MQKLQSFFLERVKQYHKVNPSVVEAVLSTGERELNDIAKKIQALDTIANSEGFDEAFSTFKRVANITKDIDLSIDLSVDSKLFEDDSEDILYQKYSKISQNHYSCYEEELDALLGLKPELDKFFESVMVNAEDEKIKDNRKSLIASIYKSILNIADIKEVSI
jgi:glycyl-tRNA synthetase beta chain